jgi:Concanavalin A-like lectin/glucanases superfamily/Calcineurin-like phosphoesterase
MIPRRLAALLVVVASCALAQESRFHTNRPNPRILPLPKEEDAFSFVIFGDRTSGVPEGLKTLALAVADVNLLAPDLVMTVGDLVQGYNDTTEWVKQANEYKAVMAKLSMPWFAVPGNHDLYYRGKDRPKTEHEADYEKHFGPLWYAFQHKGSWFVVIDSDEGNPETHKYDFNDPLSQKMSPAQFSWLEETLRKAKGADHVFVFLHHPRWLKGGYGDDWDRVHALLKSSGNVSAVFAGHIHRMRWDGVKDGIEYFTLAGTGATLPAEVPKAGFLQEFHVVTVRKGKIDVATLPVGAVMDPRAITGEMSNHVLKLTQDLKPTTTKRITLNAKWGADGLCEIEIANPIPRPIEVTCIPESSDPGFRFSPDHQHALVPGGEKRPVTFAVHRPEGPFAPGFDGVRVLVRCDYLGEGVRLTLPDERFPFAVSLPPLPEEPGAAEGALSLGGKGACLRVESGAIQLPDGPVTVEAWVKPAELKGRRGLINKTESSEFGIFVNDGKPTFSVFVGPKYAHATAREAVLKAGAWQHVAGVFDGQEARLYVDGVLAGSVLGTGERKRNALPLYVGADPDSVGKPESFFEGLVDEVRISKAPRYAGERFQPERRFKPDAATVLLLHLDKDVGPWVLDASPTGTHADRLGKAGCVPIDAR